MRVLVTGGAGFLGSHLIDRLVAEGNEVVCLDNFYTGTHRRVRTLEQDVCEPFDLDVDQIFHLACPASPAHYQRDPLFTLRTCFIGTQNVLELALKKRARVMVASTSEIYGNPLEHPQRESYFGNTHTLGPRACYDEGKRIGETLCAEYKRKGVDVRIVRIFNTYGPRMAIGDGRVVSNLIVQALRGEDLTIYGEGKQTRSFCYVDDLIEGFMRVMAHAGPSLVINLGNPIERTMLELAMMLQQLIGGKHRVVHLPATQDDPERRRPDITRAKAELGWEPRVALEDGLARTIAHFRQELGR